MVIRSPYAPTPVEYRRQSADVAPAEAADVATDPPVPLKDRVTAWGMGLISLCGVAASLPLPAAAATPDPPAISSVRDVDREDLLRRLQQLVDSLPADRVTPEQAQALLDRATRVINALDPAALQNLAASITDFRAAADAVVHHYDADQADAEAAATRARDLQTRAREMAHRLSTLDNSRFLVQGNAAMPGTPTLGRRLFAGADLRQWTEGDSWALTPSQSSFRIGIQGGMASTHGVDAWDRFATALKEMDPNDPRDPRTAAAVDFLRGEPGASVLGGLDLEYRSPRVDVRLRGQAGAVGETSSTGSVLDMYSQYAGVPGALERLGESALAINQREDVTALQQDLRGVLERVRTLADGLKGGRITPEQLAEGLATARQDLHSLRPRVDGLATLLDDGASALRDASHALDLFRSGGSESQLEVAAGAQGTLELVGRFPIPTDGTRLKNLHLAVKGGGHYVPRNPAFDESRTDRPQVRYMMGAMRTSAQVAMNGVEDLRGALGRLDTLRGEMRRTLTDIGAFAEDALVAVEGLAGSEALRQLAVLREETDLGVAVGHLQQLTRDLQAMNASLPDARPLFEDVTRLAEAGHAVLDDLERLERNLNVSADVITRVVSPTQPFGIGVGVGVGGTLVLDGSHWTPEEVNFSFTADNMYGHMRGREEVWRLDAPHLYQTGEMRFQMLSRTARNVYQDFNPRTYRFLADATVPATGTRVIAGAEKIDGVDGYSTYLGFEQPVDEWNRVRVGVYERAEGEPMHMIGWGFGREQGLRMDAGLASETARDDSRSVQGNLSVSYRF